MKFVLLCMSLVILAFCQFSKRPEDCVEGQKIVTRRMKTDTSYRIRYRCLCPIDFVSWRCLDHRQIKCLLTPRKITPEKIN